MRPLSPIERLLIDRWQRGFPLLRRPYEQIAQDTGVSEQAVFGHLARLIGYGIISRIGATLRPNTAGASLLAAMQVPAADIERVAAIVNREPGVNHNYEREHGFNLWFVVTGADTGATQVALQRIRAATGRDILELPLERSYFIDLGFGLDLDWGRRREICGDSAEHRPAVDPADVSLLRAIGPGLPLVSEPYREIGSSLGMPEAEVIERLSRLARDRVITRFGLIVRHRALGISANAMAVWDVPDAVVDAAGARLAREPGVTLCYRRPRRPPDWRYNLFCMVHGRERQAVMSRIAELTEAGGLRGRPNEVLFSRRCFRQRGPSLCAA